MKINCADAMTMITGNLCVPVDRLYALYNEFLDENLYTHQLPRAGKFTEPIVKEQLPELTAYLASRTITPENWQREVMAARKSFGDSFEIQTATQAWQHINPLEEPILAGKEVIVVGMPERAWKESRVWPDMYSLHDSEGAVLAEILRIGNRWGVYLADRKESQGMERDKESAMRLAEQLVDALTKAEGR